MKSNTEYEVGGSILIADEDDRKLITKSYRDLLRSIKATLTEQDRRDIRAAYELAVKAHSEQRRKSGEPYILHPIAVARICAEEIGLGATAVICALLHDVVEDTVVTLDEIRQMFGEQITLIVDGLTKLDRATLHNDEEQAENFKKVLSTLTIDVRVSLIKMADRLHNLRTIGSMPVHKQIKIAAETTYVYAPLAHRLGLNNIKVEFQDLCMKISDRANYDEIASKLNETKSSRNKYINDIIEPIKKLLDESDIPYRILGRPKSIYSIYNKIKGKKVAFEDIYDLFAIRIIIDVEPRKEKSTCWQVYSYITDVYLPVPERLKDWITTPKSNGYESLHTTVVGPDGKFVEIQIRSERMDDISERGFAAHWKYKGVMNRNNNSVDVYQQWFDKVREMVEVPSNDARQFLDDFKSNLFQEEVYVFTPKGDMRMLPKGATGLDFAFDLHSEVGYHCTAIKINNVLVPLSHKLSNGDQVTVITNKTQKPNEGWLKMVVTGKARSKIRSAMKDEQRKHGEIGKETLQRKLKALKVDFEENIEFLCNFFNLRSRLDLYSAITQENINLLDIKNIPIENGRFILPPPVVDKNPAITWTHFPSKPDLKPRLLINSTSADGMEYSMAACCNPVMGDHVFAFISAIGQGFKIHRYNCPNAENLLSQYAYRVMKAEWVSGAYSFVAHLKLTGIDNGIGVINNMSTVVSNELNLNIRNFFIESVDDSYFEARISIVVANSDQLQKAMTALKGLSYVNSVTRENK